MDFARTQTHEPRDFLNSLKFSVPIDTLKCLNNRRVECPKCHRKRHLYCYDCMIPLESILPQIHQLPLKCIVIQHPRELKSKSSAIQAKVIAGDSVFIVQYDSKEMNELMMNVNRENAILLYPDAKAWSLDEIIERLFKDGKNGMNDECPTTTPKTYIETHSDTTSSNSNKENTREWHIKKLEYVVFIDSTWQQSGRIFRDDRVHTLTHVKIKTQKTAFWRYQNRGNDFLATVEAIYWLYREYYVATHKQEYTNEFDDLLILYRYQYDLIQSTYKENNKSFRRIGGYIAEEKKNKASETCENTEENTGKNTEENKDTSLSEYTAESSISTNDGAEPPLKRKRIE